MNPWPKHPVIYEINTWVWLNELSRKYEKPVTLATVPSEEWDYLSSFGADAVWFMGVWERSPVVEASRKQTEDEVGHKFEGPILEKITALGMRERVRSLESGVNEYHTREVTGMVEDANRKRDDIVNEVLEGRIDAGTALARAEKIYEGIYGVASGEGFLAFKAATEFQIADARAMYFANQGDFDSAAGVVAMRSGTLGKGAAPYPGAIAVANASQEAGLYPLLAWQSRTARLAAQLTSTARRSR